MPDVPDPIARFEEELIAGLEAAGVKPAYASRLVAEVSEHAWEIRRAAGHGCDPGDLEHLIRERLGDVETIVGAACADRRNLQWARRSPLMVFVLGPAMAVPLGFAALCLGIVGAIEAVDAVIVGPAAERVELQMAPILKRLVEGAEIGIPILVATAIGGAGRRARSDPGWVVAASLTLIASTASSRMHLEVPDRLGADGSIGFGVGEPAWNAFGLFAVTLLWLVFTDRGRRTPGPAQDG